MRILIACTVLAMATSCSQSNRRNSNSSRVRVDAGGHQLEVLVEGIDRGHPTVILESGHGGGIETWAAVRKGLSEVTRVVSYNRAGSGGSQPGPRPRSSLRVAQELRVALENLNIAPPYVLVGHSIGGLYVRQFAGMHRNEVEAVVLVDPTMEFRESLTAAQVETRLKQIWGSDYARIETMLDRVHPKMAALAAHSMLELEPYLAEIPILEQKATRGKWLNKFVDRSQQMEAILVLLSDAERQELFAAAESMRAVRDFQPGGTPVTLLIAGKQPVHSVEGDDPAHSTGYIHWAQTARQLRYSEYMDTIPNGRMRTLPDAGHIIQKDRPDAIIDAVMSFLSAPSSER